MGLRGWTGLEAFLLDGGLALVVSFEGGGTLPSGSGPSYSKTSILRTWEIDPACSRYR